MQANNKLKVFNDPIYGFITIPNSLIFQLIEHNFFQRLRRISQMGLSYLVYPGAHHTRFHHGIGSMYLMQKALRILRYKGVTISADEENALYIAILLHDIGHGPFSHAVENILINGVSHETISELFMTELNKEFNSNLTLAIKIFKGDYERKFMCQLISSQLDMDRIDYLKRDSFYSGAAEGNINSERIITMLNVKNNMLVVEEKGIYSVEKFLVARRLMYWQVYLHKTSLVAEQLLIRVLERAKNLLRKGEELNCSAPLKYFLTHDITLKEFDSDVLLTFSKLDDNDIVSALKDWQNHSDFVLNNLSQMIINRDLLKIKISKNRFKPEILSGKINSLMQKYEITESEAKYFAFSGIISNQAYQEKGESINILYKSGEVQDIVLASDQLNLRALSKPVSKYYICYPKD